MNELFEFRKHLNAKKVIGFVGLLIVLLIIIVFFFSKNKEHQLKKAEDSSPYKTYTSMDNRISLELPKRYNLQENQSDSALQLQSDDGLLINIEEKTIVVGKSLKEIATSDKSVYPQKFENTFELSDLQEFSLENNNLLSSYKYSFKHINQAIEYNIQVFWIQGDTQYYIITISIPKNTSSKYEGIQTEIISSFKIN